jgi:tetratricopeptide (TPR) repeat protein
MEVFSKLRFWLKNYSYSKTLKIKDLHEELSDYTRVIELDPQNANAYSERGWFRYQQLNDTPGALSDYDIAIKLNPELANAYYYRGVLKTDPIRDFVAAAQDLRYAAYLYRQQGAPSKYVNWSLHYLYLLGLKE